jgi:integrase
MFSTDREKSDKTIASYLERSAQIVARFTRETGLCVFKDQFRFEMWLSQKKTTWTQSTWRRYKAGLIVWCDKEDYASLKIALKNTSNEGCKDDKCRLPAKERKTSGKRAKKVSDEELKTIKNATKSLPKRSYWAREGMSVFFTCLYTGMRPCELETAEIIPGEFPGDEVIKITNGKQDKERAHGEFRHLTITDFPSSWKADIRKQLSRSKRTRNATGHKISHKTYIHHAGIGFSNLIQRLFPNKDLHITIYTARHQFSANAKRNGKSREQVAAMMGHRTTRTAGLHYGKRRSGSLGFTLPKEHEAEVARVRKNHRHFSIDNIYSKKATNNAQSAPMRP